MPVPHITSFCWCMGLEVGAKCVGFLHLTVSVSLMLASSIFADKMRGYIGTAEDLGDGLYSTWYRIAVGAALGTVVHVLLAWTLIISIYKRSTAGLRVWVCVMCALYAAALACVCALAALHGFNSSGSDIFISFLEGLLFFGILAYCILCVYSYYLMMKSAEDMEGPNKTQY